VARSTAPWQPAFPPVVADLDAALDRFAKLTTPFRGEKGTPFEGGWRVPGLMWWPQHIQAGAQFNEMMSQLDFDKGLDECCVEQVLRIGVVTGPPWARTGGPKLFRNVL
jgi:Sulfatase